MFVASHNFKQRIKPVCTIKFCDYIKIVKQVLRDCDHLNRPLGRECAPLMSQDQSQDNK